MNYTLKRNDLGYYEVANKPTSDELQAYYAEKYYQESKGSYEAVYTPPEERYIYNQIKRKHAVISKYNKSPQNLLDVGCGEGFTLAYFKKIGLSVKGIDYSSAGVASKNPDCMDDLEVGDIFELFDAEIKSNNKYDIIWLQNVLEHVLDPVRLLKDLHNLVSYGEFGSGIFVITVPNDFSIVQLTAKKLGLIENEFWVAPPDHLSYFNYRSLVNIVESTGWNVIEAISDFPIDWFLYNDNSNYVMDKKVGKAAHKARVMLDNMISDLPAEDVIEFYSSMAKLGIGRDITVFVQSK